MLPTQRKPRPKTPPQNKRRAESIERAWHSLPRPFRLGVLPSTNGANRDRLAQIKAKAWAPEYPSRQGWSLPHDPAWTIVPTTERSAANRITRSARAGISSNIWRVSRS